MTMHHHSVLTGAPRHPDQELLDMHADATRLRAESKRANEIYWQTYADQGLATPGTPGWRPPQTPQERATARHAELVAFEAAFGFPAPGGDLDHDPLFDELFELHMRMLDVRAGTVDGLAAKLYAVLEMTTVLDLRLDEPEPENLRAVKEADGWDRAMYWSLWRDLKAVKPELWG